MCFQSNSGLFPIFEKSLSHGRTDRRMDGQTVGLMDGHTGGWTDGQTDGQTDKWRERKLDKKNETTYGGHILVKYHPILNKFARIKMRPKGGTKN